MEAPVDDSGSGGIFADVGRGDGKLTQILAALLLVAFLACLVLWGISGLKAVPDVVGMTKAEAAAALEKAGFAVGSIVPREGSAEQDGKVVEQSPRAGYRVSAGSAVTLTVAQAGGTSTAGGATGSGAGAQGAGIGLPEWTGNPPREDTIVGYDSAAMPAGRLVPSVMGMSRSAALSAVASAGFAGSVRHARSTTNVPPGAVVAQQPSAESYQPAGTTIVIWLSTGPPPAGYPYDKAPYN